MTIASIEPAKGNARRAPDLLGPNAVPSGAITWQSPAERQRALNAWRHAVLHAFPRDARVIKVAWIIRDLMDGGFCFASDRYISEQSGVPMNKVTVALGELEAAGAIIRGTVLKGRERVRRIFPASRIMPDPPPVTGGPPTPRDGTNPPPVTGGQNNKGQRARTLPTLGPRNALSGAALDAELRRRRAEGLPMPWDE